MEYKTEFRSIPETGRPSNSSWVFVYFNEINVDQRREFVLYDFNSMIANVGGSLGLFLGFSFLDFVCMVINLAAEYAGKVSSFGSGKTKDLGKDSKWRASLP